jgi:hypothetical protein
MTREDQELLPYDPAVLDWNEMHTINAEKTYCYCAQDRCIDKLNVQCGRCENWFHEDCMSSKLDMVMPFTLNYRFTCALCVTRIRNGLQPRIPSSGALETDGLVYRKADEDWERIQPTWKDSIFGALANMVLEKKQIRNDLSPTFNSSDTWFFPKDVVANYIDAHWSVLCIGRVKSGQWYSSMAATMHNNMDAFRFIEGAFSLAETNLYNIKPSGFNTRTNVRKLNVLDPMKKPRLSGQSTVDVLPIAATAQEALEMRSRGLDSFRYSNIAPELPITGDEIPFNKDNYKYELAETDPLSNHGGGFRVQRTFGRLQPQEQIILSSTDRSPQVKIEQDGRTATNKGGYRTVRSNVGVKEGTWFFEVEVLAGGGEGKTDFEEHRDGAHLRIGWARREGICIEWQTDAKKQP